MAYLNQDVRFALRTLTKNPAFTAVAVIALALGIGANTAIFSVVNGVLLQPLPYRDPGRLVQLSEKSPDFNSMSVSYLNYLDWRDRNRSFDSIAAFRWDDYDVTGGGEAEHVKGKMVSAGFFRTLGIVPIAGRDFDPSEDRLGTTPVAMISGELWSRRFGSSPGVIGRQIMLNGHDYTLIGVIPAGFDLRGKAEAFTLMGQWDDVMARSREMHPGIYVVGSLRPGVTMQRAQADMSAIGAQLAQTYPQSNAKHGVTLTPLAQVIVGDVRPTLLVLLGAVGFVLLIACANVANLLLARSTRRRKEMAIRAALGASRSRMTVQLLTESLILALGGGLAGLAVARWGAPAVLAAVPGGLPRMEHIAVDGWVLAFTMGLSLLTGLVFGMAPALQVSASFLNETLQEGNRGSTAGPHRLRSMLVVCEVAAALVLLVGAGLMLRTMAELNGVNPGFNPRNVLTFSVGLSPANTASGERILQSLDETVDRIRKVPGVKSASLTTLMPLAGSDNEIPFYVNGRPKPATQGDMNWALMYATGPGYQETMEIPLLRGRFLGRQDNSTGHRVVVIDENLSRSLFPNQDPIGNSLRIADLGDNLGPELNQPMEIVGVVGHVKHWGLDSDATAPVHNQLYMPLAQIPGAFLKQIAANNTMLARTGADVLGMTAAVRRAVLEGGADQPVFDVQTMEQIVTASVAGRRLSMLLLAIFAALAVLLAAVGIYGVISYGVAQRTHEIGIRMALGARPRDVLASVVGQGMGPVAIGVAAGWAASFALTRVMEKMLYGVKADDPVTFAGVALGLMLVAVAAMVIPARRAMNIDPTVALRHE